MLTIYFQPEAGLEPEHPALRKVETVNHTLCADQIPASMVLAIYQYPPFARFLAATMGKAQLHVMQDPLASVNVMAYRSGERRTGTLTDPSSPPLCRYKRLKLAGSSNTAAACALPTIPTTLAWHNFWKGAIRRSNAFDCRRERSMYFAAGTQSTE